MQRRWSTVVLLTAGLALAARVNPLGAAPRMVLGEYFTATW